MIQLYTGDGKGKTTAAFGLAMRAAGRGKRVAVLQFFKQYGSGETLSAQKLGVDVHASDITVPPWDKAAAPLWEKDTLERFELAKSLIDKVDMLVLDELTGALHKGILTQDEILALMDAAGDTELILTGRNAAEALVNRADLVTEMRCVKHYFERGLPAREGVEY